MAKAHVVSKKVLMTKKEVIKYQLVTYCFIHKFSLSDNELDCLTLLGITGPSELSNFCNKAVEKKIFKTSQTVRNFLTKAVKLNLVIKKGSNKKTISFNDTLQIQTTGNIILDFNMIHVTKEQ